MIGKLERNTFANLGGTFWSIAAGLVCVPLFIRILGAEAFGLTGLFLTLQGVFAFLDLGIGATLNREIARLDATNAGAGEQRDLLFTLQAIYWVIAIAIGAAVFLFAPLIAARWIHPQSLSVDTVRLCVRLMGIAIALQFPFVLYQCGLLGLQRHVLFNAFNAVMATLRAPGILLLLWLVSPAPQMFFAGQIAVSAVATAGCAALLWRLIPAPRPATFRRDLLRRHWRFGAAYSANSLANLALLQGDKIILSAMLPLGMFGYYSMAQRLAGGLYAAIVAVDGAIFPRFSAVAARAGDGELARTYHRACQLMAVLLMPAAAVTAFFSREILQVWTGDAAAVAHTHLVLALLVAGMLLHALMQAPYFLQVAHDRWRLIARTNAVLLVTILPAYVVMARLYGAAGAAAVWVALNLGYLTMVPRMHRTLLPGEGRRWLLDDVLLPLAGAVAVAAAAHAAMPAHLGSVAALAYAAVTGLLATIAAAALAPNVRRMLVPSMKRVAEPA
jgi:O-antigen/teichoic acid export membrane protein